MIGKAKISTIKLASVALLAVVLLNLVSVVGTPARVSAQSQDNVVLDWNLHASNAFMNPATAATPGAGMPPQVGSVHMAIVHGAVYDAVIMIEGGYEPYMQGLPEADEDASVAAAVATAAHDVIVGVDITPPLAPEIVDRVDDLLAASLAAATVADGEAAVAAGVAAGEAAAAAMLATRENDGRYVPQEVVAGTEPGDWRPTPPANIPDPFAWMGNVKPFMLDSATQFQSKGPRPIKSLAYARDYNEVKKYGGATGSSARNDRQEAVAQFFTVNPVEMYNRAFRTFADERGLSTVEQARLFAMLNLTGADSLITCFKDKLTYNFWRPITAIHNGSPDGNWMTTGDPTWTSMVPSPPYSEHSSGYNCVTAGFMHAAADFFGHGRVNFSLVKVAPGVADVTRTYRRFTDVIKDTIDARVYQGIHFRTSDIQGAKIGKHVARWMDQHYFQEVR